MVAAGGAAVLVVVAFVAVLFLGTGAGPGPAPGDRLAVGLTPGGALSVRVPRCPSERVVQVSLGTAAGATVWEITSAKGSINQSYAVTDEAPLGFVVTHRVGGAPPEGPLVATAVLSRPDDEQATDATAPFLVSAVPADPEVVLYRGVTVRRPGFEARARSVADCPESRRHVDAGLIVLAAAALGVVLAYGTMVGRWWRGRRQP